jgi:hypothetical protein
MRRRRFVRWAKWTSTLAAVLCVGVAVFSGCFNFYWSIESNDRKLRWDVAARSGLLCLYRFGVPALPRPQAAPSLFVDVSWRWGLAGEDVPSGELWGWRAGISWMEEGGNLYAGVSVLYPVLLTTIPAAILWYKDRRRFGPHTCPNCNYDRHGLPTEANCPECGTTPAHG